MSTHRANPAPRAFAAVPVVAAIAAVLALRGGDDGGLPGTAAAIAVWCGLMLAPGLVLDRVFPDGDRIRGALAAAALSPVVLAILAATALMAGLPPRAAAAAVALATALGGLVVWLRPARAGRSVPVSRREAVALAALLVAAVALVTLLPLVREWWRVRSDAWFHAAVVAQIRDYGLPPEDPYFLGLPLQYMWLYHAMVLVLADTMRVDVFRVMAWCNVQALAGLCLAGWSLAGVFRAGVAHRFAATATLLFTFNAAFWVFLPLKALRALTGEIRGAEELARVFSLRPFTYDQANQLLHIYNNQEFFLDKFMVATAFGMALTLMTVAWYAGADYLATRRRGALVVLALAMLGMLGFHSLVGFVMLAGLGGGAALLLLLRRRVAGLRARDVLAVVAISLACLAAAGPYLHELMHLKERAQIIPVSFSLAKTLSILIACAFVLVVALRGRVLFADASPAPRFFLFGAAAVTAFCLSIRLPGPNTFDKLGYFVFIPASILAGFAIADSVTVRRGAARVRAAFVWGVLFFLPVNALAIAAAFNTPADELVTAPEERLSAWVRAHTPREAVFIDADDRVFLLVTGPRRYYWGRWAYADQWGYPRLEMAQRFHASRSLYRTGPLDALTLAELAAVPEPLYVVARPADRAAAVASTPALFTPVYDDGAIALYEVDRAACRDAVAAAPPAPPAEELLHAFGP